MNIDKISKITGLSSHTLRYYEKIGLILNVKRDSKGHRDYSKEDVAWIEFLKRLKATGMSLGNIKKFAEYRYKGDATIQNRLDLLEMHYSWINQNIDNMLKHREKIEEKIEIYKNWSNNS